MYMKLSLVFSSCHIMTAYFIKHLGTSRCCIIRVTVFTAKECKIGFTQGVHNLNIELAGVPRGLVIARIDGNMGCKINFRTYFIAVFIGIESMEQHAV